MSVHLPPPNQFGDPISDDEVSSGSSEGDNEEETWDDWHADSNEQQPCKSLFDDTVFPSVSETLEYDKERHGIALLDIFDSLALDFHQRVRFVNYVRKNKPTPSDVRQIKASESWLTSDEYLVPVVENDPFLQLPTNDWSDSEDEDAASTDPNQRIKILEKKLSTARQSLAEYRDLIAQKLNVAKDLENVAGPSSSEASEDKPTGPVRDDDTHYFESYGANDIHAVMIQDKVRTSSYANFILTNPNLFRDATVLDVGCGTGILSLFAARAGAKRVISVDASDIALKAEKIVKANGFENVITVIRGKIENVSMPEDIDKVDIIISEWMGYALLYESMLDSVLTARDRFLRPGGVMAPSQCKMMLGLCDASEIWKERLGFWDDVYGFDMSVMTDGLYDESIVDVVGPETILCKPYPIKDLILSDVSAKDLDFSSSFTITASVSRRTKVSAFVLYFDTFFTASGNPVPPSTEVKLIKEGEIVLAELWPVGGKPAHLRRQSTGNRKEKITSFSTGPLSQPTHWKQTLFMLREPVMVSDESVVIGSFRCRKRESNSRELDVEIHYSVKENEGAPLSDTIVQMYTVR